MDPIFAIGTSKISQPHDFSLSVSNPTDGIFPSLVSANFPSLYEYIDLVSLL